MIDVELIPIDIIMPSDAVRIVSMQPFIHLQNTEPFKWLDSAANVQLNAVRRTLDLAQSGFGGGFANFTLFPEYSIPGINGAAVIEEKVASGAWPNGSVIIAGIGGLTKAEYEYLCKQLDVKVSPADAPNSVPNSQWVNCCLVWVKERDGFIRRWAQPKIRPAWREMNVSCNDMFSGSTVYVFECQYAPIAYPCRFVTFVCFDWVASPAGTAVRDEVLARLNARFGSPKPIHWVFVIQHNQEPNHPLFLNSTCEFLTDVRNYPFVDRREAIVLHVNTASTTQPSRNGRGAFSSCVFSPRVPFDCTGCRPTVCMKPRFLRGSDILDRARCKDVVFREMGECIHLFKVRVPCFVSPGPNDRTYPLIDAQVHPTNGVTDPRLCRGPVPADVKWLNDSLDCVTSLATTALAGCPLHEEATTVQPGIISGMRALDGGTAANRVNWAACSFSYGKESRNADRQQNVDLWNQLETDALEHVIHSLTSLGLASDLDVRDSSLHGTIESDTGFIQVVAIRGETYEDCRRHYDNAIPKVTTDPVLVIARDRQNFRPITEEYSKFNETDSGLGFLDYQTLVSSCRDAGDKDALRRCLNGFLPRNRRII
ncbi:MAG: hypothetical protein AB1510_09835 [Bacillota bacterium]